ncbi:MAG: hypothetical protein HZA67_00820 [Rhodospirillales bacterium]|jgi:hypothetical protein|nr:hypothetical protein [Rhodospirillales bacterium]
MRKAPRFIMRLIRFAPPFLVLSFAFLGVDLFNFVQHGVWPGATSAELLNGLGLNIDAPGFWMNMSPAWPLLVLGLAIGEAGLVQNRILDAKEQRMIARLRVEAEERRAKERHADMLVRRERRVRRILDHAA